jgi:polysaccharide biosynthesis/export protein
MKEQRSAFISVLGEVNNPARLALSGGGERIADSLARAGGPKARGFETTVTVQRGEKRGTANLLDVVNSDDNNIFLQPGDTVYVKSEARTFLAFGATGESGQFDFLKERITLAEAIGKARGLLDERAEPSSVFLYRLETRDRAKSIGIDISKWGDSDTIPIIYSLNLRDPSGFFVAGLVPMQPADILYIDNASSVNFNKFLSLVFNATNVVRATRLTANGL